MAINFGRYWKAIIAFIAPGVVLIGHDLTDGDPHLTWNEWVTALVTMVVTAAGVYAKANK